MADLTTRIDAFQQELQSVSQEALGNDESRKRLLGVVMQGMAMLEAPIETIWRMIMTVRNISTKLAHYNSRCANHITDSLINLLHSCLWSELE